ncbi:hypothetical protein FOYG_09525 [Fusarium oxysporum NRRL 32931]|uniref:Uncharacterized protein n=1 Tax=Fusarium oxysporum NRRL 32931 TaxID=660029 RepID=W9I069_FUSOX|nr:hypothetical protein FOYG_09525 [Fusarium oxysporum NRRL 32931]
MLPRNLLRISTMPRLHSPKPFFSCRHLSGRVLTRGSRRQSAALLRSTMTQSDSWRHCASASPGKASGVRMIDMQAVFQGQRIAYAVLCMSWASWLGRLWQFAPRLRSCRL